MFSHKNIKLFYLRVTRKTRDFLLSDKSREFLVFLFFFIVAFGFWLLQTLNYDYETELTIPIKLKEVPSDVVLTSEFPEEVKVTVKDKGTILLNYLFGKSFYPITINFTEYKGQKNYVLVPFVDIEKKITSQLSASTKLISIKPEIIDYIYSKEKAKKIPVRFQGNISAGKQYYIADTLCSPDSVVIFATQLILDTIKAAYTQPFNFQNITDTTQHEINLIKIKGAKFIPSSTKITLLPDIYTEKSLEVPLTGINFPIDKILRTFPSKVKVSFQVGLSKFKSIEAGDFLLNIPYEELLKERSDKYQVKINLHPAGISNIRISPEEVDFLIEQAPSHEY